MVDDEPDIREGLEALLTGENYRVDLAAGAAEGFKRLESNLYDPVLLDLSEEDVSGVHSTPHSGRGAKFQPLIELQMLRKGSRYFQNVEAIRGIGVILATFVDHPEIAVLSSFGVGH